MGLSLAITIVTRQTRLEGLRQRWGTVGQAKFLLAAAHEHAELAEVAEASGSRASRSQPRRPTGKASVEADFDMYQREEAVYKDALEKLEQELNFGLPVKVLDRSFLPNYDFSRSAVVVVLGQDGLVANTAKYVRDIPIIGVNPDPDRIDGVLLPFKVAQAAHYVGRVLERRHSRRSVTLAELLLNDGQKLLAFNDFFIGAASHVSARYTLQVGGSAEPQSSSGVLVSTGAGSTGWMSSVFNMARGVGRLLGADADQRPQLGWEDRRLLWAVREPFVSKSSRAGLVAGVLPDGESIQLESLMPEGGVIFSDGIESDFLPFTTGSIATVRASGQAAQLVVP
jgi:hypothetical protein